MPDWLTFAMRQRVALILAAPVAAWLPRWLSTRAERRRMRRDVLRRLAGHRYLVIPGFQGRDGEYWVSSGEPVFALLTNRSWLSSAT